ncbi:uncharacterized protein BKA78DRAFT_312020 [Phyllosticta capitalensis]|uniref:uncharacterized protein n=1 Tax=Phyllosticta capitalensis TaxID=121624 RepID=UPI00313244E2
MLPAYTRLDLVLPHRAISSTLTTPVTSFHFLVDRFQLTVGRIQLLILGFQVLMLRHHQITPGRGFYGGYGLHGGKRYNNLCPTESAVGYITAFVRGDSHAFDCSLKAAHAQCDSRFHKPRPRQTASLFKSSKVNKFSLSSPSSGYVMASHRGS